MSSGTGAERPRRSVLALAGVAGIVLLAPLWVLHLVPRPEPRDFYVDWMAARDMVAGRPLYRPLAEEQALIGVAGTFNVGYTTHPPTAGLLALPLAGLDYRTALLVWNLVGLALFAATIRLVARELGWSPERSTLLIGVALLMAWVPLWDVVEHGQSGLVVLGLLAVGWRALRRDADVTAGIALGTAAALKIYPGLLLVYLLLAGRRRAVAVAAVTVLVLAGVVVAIAGPSAWTRFAALGLPELRRWWPNWMGVSLTGFATRLFMPDEKTMPLVRSPAVAAVVVAGGTLAALAATAAACARDRANLDRAFALVTTLSLLVSTVAWPHYFVVLLLPLAIVLSVPPPVDRAMLGGLVVTWLLMNVPQVPIAMRVVGAGPAPPLFALTVLSANFYGLAGFLVWQLLAWRRARMSG
jgi:alpha-1,2-mannosyltransferase